MLRELDGKTQGKAHAHKAELVATDFIEEARAVTKDDRDAGDGIPNDVAEAAQAGESRGDFIPIGVKRDSFGRADGDEAPGGWSDGPGIGHVELQSSAGC